MNWNNSKLLKDLLIIISTTDVAPLDIATSLNSAEDFGEKRVDAFLKFRLQERSMDFYPKIKRENHRILANIYKVKVKTTEGKVSSVKADRDLRRLLQ